MGGGVGAAKGLFFVVWVLDRVFSFVLLASPEFGGRGGGRAAYRRIGTTLLVFSSLVEASYLIAVPSAS